MADEKPEAVVFHQDAMYAVVCEPRLSGMEREIRNGFTRITDHLERLNGSTAVAVTSTAVALEVAKATSARVLFLEKVVFGGIGIIVIAVIGAVLSGVVVTP